ncbi:MAG: hypothetical protein AUG51_11140 [Acidobacteria bacterium 13_1_20CM_3_53_8]|nr:MAG: hypothetical protein AUG51_11140 [Acidobacteria bacterium 13_1_20CM_3_53_8]
MSDENFSQSEILRKNISAVIEMQNKAERSRTFQTRIADLITAFFGSMAFVYVHAIWFGLWILLNIGLVHIHYISEFDPFPFQLLTMIVSLEAIFLSTFVLISQNRSQELSERRAELDLHVNLLAEQKAAKVLDMLQEIAQQLDHLHDDFSLKHDPEAEALKVSPEPQEVLDVIEKTVNAKSKDVKRVAEEQGGRRKEKKSREDGRDEG